MKTVWLSMFVVSGSLLGWMLVRGRVPRGSISRFGAHLAISAIAIYALNFSGWVTGWYVPLNPATIGTVAVLGLPGIALVLGLQQLLIA